MSRYLDLVTDYVCQGMTLAAAEAAARVALYGYSTPDGPNDNE